MNNLALFEIVTTKLVGNDFITVVLNPISYSLVTSQYLLLITCKVLPFLHRCVQ